MLIGNQFKSCLFLLIMIPVCSAAGPVTMDKDPLEEASHLHKQSQLRVLQCDLQQESSDLKEECKEFVNSMYINV